jgi:transposase
MPRHRPAYPPEFREQIVALHRAGRSVAELAREFEPTEHTIRAWIKKADPSPRAASAEADRDEVRRLRKEVRRLQQERDILAKAAAWFARETGSVPGGASSS